MGTYQHHGSQVRKEVSRDSIFHDVTLTPDEARLAKITSSVAHIASSPPHLLSIPVTSMTFNKALSDP